MLTCLLVAGCTLLAQAAPASPEDLKLDQDVRRFLREMDRAESIGERDAARDAIIILGPKVLSRLPAPKDTDSGDFKVRLEQIRSTLEKKQATQFTKGSTITFAGKEVPLSKVLAELEKQSGNKLLDYRERFNEQPNETPITVEVKDVPFWKALDEVFDQAGLARYPHPDETGVAYQNRPEGMLKSEARATYAGPFRLEADDLHIQRNLRRKEGGAMQLSLELVWEPRLRPIAVTHDLSAVKIVDDTGAAIEVDGENAEPEIALTPVDVSATLIIPAKVPARNAKTVTVQGKVDALLPGKIETFEFTNLAAKPPIVKRQGSVQVSLEGVRKNNAVWELRLLVKFDSASGALESHRGWVTDNPCRLVTEKGEELEPDAMELYRRDEDSIGVAYLFAVEDLKKLKLTYATPVSIVKTPIEYELKGIPLP